MTDLYQSQRAMRALRRAAMHRGVVAILDVGTLALQYYAVKAYTVAMLDHNIIQVTGTRQVKRASRFK